MRTSAVIDLGVQNALNSAEYGSFASTVITAGIVGATSGILVPITDLLSDEWKFSSRRLNAISLDIWAPFMVAASYVGFLYLVKEGIVPIEFPIRASIVGVYAAALMSRRKGIWSGNIAVHQPEKRAQEEKSK